MFDFVLTFFASVLGCSMVKQNFMGFFKCSYISTIRPSFTGIFVSFLSGCGDVYVFATF